MMVDGMDTDTNGMKVNWMNVDGMDGNGMDVTGLYCLNNCIITIFILHT